MKMTILMTIILINWIIKTIKEYLDLFCYQNRIAQRKKIPSTMTYRTWLLKYKIWKYNNKAKWNNNHCKIINYVR